MFVNPDEGSTKDLLVCRFTIDLATQVALSVVTELRRASNGQEMSVYNVSQLALSPSSAVSGQFGDIITLTGLPRSVISPNLCGASSQIRLLSAHSMETEE
jgi:hypothetical protein